MKDDFKITETVDGELEITADKEWFDYLIKITNTTNVNDAINKILLEWEQLKK